MVDNKWAAFWGVVVSVFCLVACSPPFRQTSDGILIPLRYPELPSPKSTGDSGIHLDSLYVKVPQSVTPSRVLGHDFAPSLGPSSTFDTTGEFNKGLFYFRFWADGQVLERRALRGKELGGGLTLSASDGDLLDDHLSGPSDPYAIVGRYSVVGRAIYIQLFYFVIDGLGFYQYSGEMTDDGFVLRRMRVVGLLRPGPWESIPEAHYIRVNVGQMKGTPTW